MKTKQIISIALVVVVAVVIGFFLIRTEHRAPGAESRQGSEKSDDDKRADPAPHDDAKALLSPEQIRASNIATAKAGPGRLATTLSFPGEIRFNADQTAHVVPRVSGIVEGAPALLGEQVSRGQVLAIIASASVSEMRSELAASRRRLELARTTLAREKKLWEEKISAEQDYLQARNAAQEADIAATNATQKLAAIGIGPAGTGNRIELRAPFSGMVLEKHATLGESVREDAALFTIADLTTVWVTFNVSARDIEVVQVGKRATVQATAIGTEVEGVVSYVGSLIGEQTRTATARITLKNPQGAWRPGLFVTVAVTAGEKEVPITVANDALQTLEGHTVIFTRTPDGFRAQPVKTGLSDGKSTEIIEGLIPGAEVATTGSFTVKAQLTRSAAGDQH